ncbi:MAG: PKD domain-containing protein [Candidatus Woesearchaeota archaeon]|nr:PKD domain-containing protein [Candidatus Woesearchaeota archaeon]
MDKRRVSLFIAFLLVVFLSTSVAATRYVNYNLKEGTISSSGVFTATSNPLTNVNAIGFVCADSSCSSTSGTLWSGQVQNSGTSDSMQLTYPTTLQSTYGYGIYYYKPGYITWENKADWWGTTSSDPQGPYTRYLSKKQDCYSPIDTFSVTNDAQANIPLVINVSASLDATTYAAIHNAGPLEYTPPSLLNDYYSVATRVILTIYDSAGSIVNQQTQDILIPFSGSQRVQFTWTPTISGEYTATAATTVTDAKCSSSIEQSSSKEFTVIPEQPRNMCYTILNNLATSDQFPTDGETIAITATKISNYADNNYALIPVQANFDLKITRVADGQVVKQESKAILANQNNYDPLLFSFTWPITSGKGNYNITIKGIASSSYCNGLQNLQDAASEIIYVNAKPNEAPTIAGLPDVSFNEDSTPVANLIDLWQYASDPETSASQLTYAITSQSTPSLVNCSVASNRYINCGRPASHKYGTSSITVEVSDSQYSDRDTFIANVLSINDAPTIDYLTASPTLLKGGNTVTLTPVNPNDLEQSQLYFYCSELTNEPTATSNICNEGSAYTYPYSAMKCTYAAAADTAAHKSYCRVYDGTSYSQALQAAYTTDSTPPVISPTTTALTNDNTPTITINGDGTQTSCSAAGASVTWSCTTLACNPTSAIADGNRTATVSCQDALANTASASVAFTIDTNAPITTDNAPSTWQNSDVTVTLTATDAGSGVANTYYCADQTNLCTPATSGTSATITAEGTNYLRYYSIDDVGNTEAIKSAAVMIDKTEPAITPTTAALTNDNTPTITINGDGTQTSCSAAGASVTWSCDTLTCSPTSAISDGTYSVDVSCQDIAGNAASGSVAFTIDTQVPILSNGQPTGTITTNTPVLNFTSNENAACRGTIDLDEAYSDMDFAFSGTAAIHTYLTNVLSDAMHAVYARCQDLAGNIMATSYSWSFIINATPVANANGPYAGFEGSPVAFTGLASGGAPPYTFEWDLNNDGSYETPGQNPSFTWADDYSSTIVLRVTDAENHSTTNQSSVTISNVAPTANANGPYSCNVSQSIALSGTATDPGTDTLTYDWDLNDDAAFETAAQQNPAYNCTANGTFNVNLRVTDDNGGIGYASATITASSTPAPNNAPTATVLSPNGGEVWSGTRSIAWNATDPDGDALTITIQYSYDSIPWTNITTTIPNSGIYAWDTTAVPDAATYLIRIIASDSSLTGEDVSNAIFQIDNVFAPDIEVLYPNGGETLSGTANIRWIATDGGANLSIDLYYSQNNITWTAIAINQPNTGLYSWYTPSVLDGNYLIKAVASEGNTSDEDISNTYFAIDNIPVAPSPVPAAQKPEDKLYVSKITFENDYSLSPYDDLAATVTIKNTGDTKLEDNTITLTVPDLGLRKRIGPFDLSKGESATRKLSLNLEGAAPGTYYARIVVSNDKVTRIKHRDIVIR